MTADAHRIHRVATAVYRFPTERPEADGTLEWDATVAVTVHVEAGDQMGFGWTYSSPAAADVIDHHLADVVRGALAHDIAGSWERMHRVCRNIGTRGLVMQAISAVDIAMWDLKAKLVDMPLSGLFGQCRTEVPIYGSGGFTSMTDDELQQQVGWWQAAGCTAMKIKIGQAWGTEELRDLARVGQLREFAGPDAALMVDANGGYTVGQARRIGAELDELGVIWFEEPVSSDDTEGLQTLRRALRCDVAAGEYASDLYAVAALLPVVDCLQLDVTRCGGYTGWLRGAALAQSRNLQVSAHCAPALHTPVAAAVPNLRHVEWFVDHVRLEPLLASGTPEPADGVLRAQDSEPGHGMTLQPDSQRYLVSR